MRTRSSGSTDDDNENNARSDQQPLTAADSPRPSSHDEDKRSSFTSAKYDLSRNSDTLDRRKVEKSLPTGIATQNWSEDSHVHVAGQEKSKTRSGAPAAGGKMDPKDWRRSRIRSPWRCSMLTAVTTFVSILALYGLFISFTTKQKDTKGCQMSYHSPSYAKLTGFDTEHTRFASKYELFLYREGGVDKELTVKGVPVLFIPGNAGSFKQVRSFAGEAAKYFYSNVVNDADAMKNGVRNLDFFTANFNEDITAFHGQTLLDQAEYLNEAVAYILSMYHDPNRSRRDPGLPDPSSVIIIGHSMGGIVARTMLTMPNYQSNSINTILTMATPHARAPISFDSDIVQTYQNINDYWRQAYSQKWASDNPLWHVTLISIAGGGLDTTVPSDYASLSSLVPETHGFTVFTSTIPTVWTGSDHVCILWCNQLLLPVAKALLEVVDVRRPSQTKPRADRMRVFKKWFLTGLEEGTEKTLPQKSPTTLLTLEDNSNSVLASGERLVLRQLGITGKPKAYLLPIPPQEMPGDRKQFTLFTDQQLKTDDSAQVDVLMCSVFPLTSGHSSALFSMNMDLSGSSSGSNRLACKNAASDLILLPEANSTSKYPFFGDKPQSYLQYKLEDLAEHQFVAVVDKNTALTNGFAIAEFSSIAKSRIYTDLGLASLLMNGLRTTLPADRPVSVTFDLPAIRSSLLAYKLQVGPQACGDGAEMFKPMLRQFIAEPHESKFFIIVKVADINLHGIAPFMPPPLKGHDVGQGVSLQLWSDPTCNSSIELNLQVDIGGSFGKLFMRYRIVLVAFPLIVIALVLRKQFMVHDATGVFMSFSEALDLCLRSSLPVLLLAMTFLATSLAGSSSRALHNTSAKVLQWRNNGTASDMDYTQNDYLLGSQDPFFWFLIPLSGIIAAGMCVLLNYAVLLIIQIFYVIYSTLASKPAWMRKDPRKANTASGFAVPSPRRRIIITLLLVMMISTIMPYQFAFVVACIVQIATCTRALRVAKETRSPQHQNFYNYVHSILVLMLWILPINIPVLVVWIHNLSVHWLTPFSSHHNVLSVMPFVLLVETLTGGRMIPRMASMFRHVTNLLLFFLALYAAVYGLTFAYQLHHIANLLCLWLVIVHSSSSGFSLKSLSKILEGDTVEGTNPKKIP